MITGTVLVVVVLATELCLLNEVLGVEVRWSIRGTKDFGFVRSSEGEVSVVVDMDYVASDELGNFVRLGIVLEVHFALDDVCNSWARVVCGDGHADGKLTDSCQ